MNKTIIFYYHNFGWYWHGNRLSLIIQKIISDFSGEYNIIVLNGWEKQDFLWKQKINLKIINLPNYQIQNYQILENSHNKKVEVYRQSIFHKLFSITKIESVIIEHFPFGRNFLDIEVKNFVNIYRKYNNRWSVFSSVRDIFEINSIRVENLELFDRFLIHSDENVLNYEKFFDEKINNKIIYTWYIVNDLLYWLDLQEKNHILISIWWWQDWLNWVIDFLKKFNKINFDWKIYLNLGKSYTEDNISKIVNIYKNEIEIKPYFDNYLELKLQAKLVVSMWWYNNLTENLFYNKKSIIYPRLSDNEQKKRLEVFSQKVNYIFDGNNLDHLDIENILLIEPKKLFSINMTGVYFTSSFLVNYKKYKYIKIRLTNFCNAKCDMCWVIKRKLENNDFEKMKKSILDFYKLWWIIVNFTWWEPTIYKWFLELLKYCKELWLITSISTNWSTLSKSFYEKVSFNWKIWIDYIDISIDWLYDLHNKIRAYPGLFEIIENNLDCLKDLWVNIHINVTIRKDNILVMKDIFDYFKRKKVDSISFWMIQSAYFNDTTNLIPDRESLKNFYLSDKKYILANRWEINISFSPDYEKYSTLDFNNFINLVFNKNSFEKIDWNKCNFISSKKEIRINENWNISPCCMIDDYDENIWNINKTNLLNIICSKKYEDFLNKKFPDISQACLNCKIEI